ncbi:25880_t:CDS:2 [Gigaspora margarita]|uniref:25880_t:CDS:1 n=1 Tax=Gigaspora margarita TaxID=4874 RepID=A0ABN7UM59_GIGMA|nr:25880_t:CDS:2 [Gigaspora margarita]
MSHYSFSSQYYETLKQFQKNINTPLEEVRRNKKNFIPTISDTCIVDEVKLDEKYVIKSKEYLVDKLKIYEDVIDEKWQDLDNNGLYGEWIKVKDMKDARRVVLYLFGGGFCYGSTGACRSLTCKIAETAECPVFAINYRLSPEYQFPAQLCDALAAYLYLTNPGPEAGFDPFNPRQIIFSGSSAGGGLAVATALFLRDADLPLPSGLVLWSAWVDLTGSMPSCLDPEMDKTDYLPAALSIIKFKSLASEFHERAKLLEEKIKQGNPKVVGHPSFTKVPRFMLHCANEALAIPYVSPMLAESLGNLPPILCQVGGGERLLDSSILFSFRASEPNKFQVPKYATMNFVNSRFKKPTEVILEVYDELCHSFQRMLPDKIIEFSIKRSCDFIKNHTLNEHISDEADSKSLQGNHKTITAIAISPHCEIRELDEKYLECLNWENIGVVPEIEV